MQAYHLGFQTLKVQKHATQIYNDLRNISSRFNKHFDGIVSLRKTLEEALNHTDDFGRDARSIMRTLENIKTPQSVEEKTEKTNAAITSGIFSNGEIAFLQLAGALDADSSIRQIVNKESSVLAEVGNGILRKVIFWRKGEKSGVLVDAEKEAKRLRQVVAEGEPITKGETPVIVRKKKGLLEGIF